MVLVLAFLVCLVLQVVIASTVSGRPRQQESAPNASPLVQLRLAPPIKPQPQLAAELANLEQSRENLQASFHVKLQRSAEIAFKSCKKQIDALIDSNMHWLALSRRNKQASAKQMRTSFLASFVRESSDDVTALKINLLPVPPLRPIIQDQIDIIESRFSIVEMQLLEQAHDEMQRITDIVLIESAAKLAKYTQAFAGRPSVGMYTTAFAETSQQVNVMIAAASHAFPTVGNMFEAMERRRDRSELQELAYILEAEKQLFAAEIGYLSDALLRIAA